MNQDKIREKLKNSPAFKRFLDWLMMNQRDARPRWYIRLLAPLYQHRAFRRYIGASGWTPHPTDDSGWDGEV